MTENSIASAFESAICDVSDITPDCGGSTYNAAAVVDDDAAVADTPSTDQDLEELPLAASAAFAGLAASSGDLEDDIVLQHSRSGTSAARWKRPTLALLLLALIIIAISFGVSSNNNNRAANKSDTTLIQQVKKEPAPVVDPLAPPAPKPTPPPKKAAAVVEIKTPAPTVVVTDGGTATVAIDETAPPTLGERIESPTYWRG